MASEFIPAEGGCDCRALRYRLRRAPLFVHCCHCSWCQRESGAAFALNAMIEADQVELLSGAPDWVDTPSASGKGQKIARCPVCRIALWSCYSGAGMLVRFVRVGTLDQPARFPPARPRSANTTIARSTGRPRASPGAKRCWPAQGSHGGFIDAPGHPVRRAVRARV